MYPLVYFDKCIHLCHLQVTPLTSKTENIITSLENLLMTNPKEVTTLLVFFVKHKLVLSLLEHQKKNRIIPYAFFGVRLLSLSMVFCAIFLLLDVPVFCSFLLLSGISCYEDTAEGLGGLLRYTWEVSSSWLLLIKLL